MIIKKFTGKTEAEAVEAARKELGAGIVIMNVREVKSKGFFGLFRSVSTEVTAALEEEQDIRVPIRREAVKPEKESEFPVRSVLGESAQNIEQKLDSLQTLLVKQFQMSETKEAENAEKAEDIREKNETPGENPEKEENAEQDRFIRLLYNTMLDNEVDEKYANQILEDIEKSRRPNIPIDHILSNVYQKMILKFGKSEGITPAQNGPRVVLFIGPTGVGKTTTIAKIAGSYAVEQKKKIALLTMDTFRIAAAEQLHTYANIMEVPFRVVYTEEELHKAVEDFRDCDYIFVDTAGHSHQNGEQLANMKNLIKTVTDTMEHQTFLVLSATTKYKDLVNIAESYKEVSRYQLIFTKLDETLSLGNLMNLKLYTDCPIAFVTCGQNVPNDIEEFNPQKTVKLLLGGKN